MLNSFATARIEKPPMVDFSFQKTRPSPSTAQLLLVEDSASDAALMCLALDATGLPYQLRQLFAGTDVIPYLLKLGRFHNAVQPDLIFLDIGLPDRNGYDILAELAALPGIYHAIPIIIVTGHEHLEYLKKCYDLCITDYIVKPCNVASLQTILTRR